MASLEEALSAIAAEELPRLQASLARRFPGASEAAVEEAWAEALAEACDPERGRWFREGFEQGGQEELSRRLFTGAWRQLRGELRKVGHQRTHRMATGFDAAMPAGQAGGDAEAQAQAAELEGWLASRVAQAGREFGRARAGTLEAALSSLVRAGHAVKPLAERYSLPRRYLAEASVWLRRRLKQRSEE